MPSIRTILLAIFLAVTGSGSALAQAPVAYRLQFPEREHRLMQVEITFADVPAGPLQLRMSRTSPGRYALHEFAKNVFDVRVAYKVFGDRVDGTYLGIDSTHAHINMPAALMWARGYEMRPATVRFEP